MQLMELSVEKKRRTEMKTQSAVAIVAFPLQD
jgi:hypothetical protein